MPVWKERGERAFCKSDQIATSMRGLTQHLNQTFDRIAARFVSSDRTRLRGTDSQVAWHRAVLVIFSQVLRESFGDRAIGQ